MKSVAPPTYAQHTLTLFYVNNKSQRGFRLSGSAGKPAL